MKLLMNTIFLILTILSFSCNTDIGKSETEILEEKLLMNDRRYRLDIVSLLDETMKDDTSDNVVSTIAKGFIYLIFSDMKIEIQLNGDSSGSVFINPGRAIKAFSNKTKNPEFDIKYQFKSDSILVITPVDTSDKDLKKLEEKQFRLVSYTKDLSQFTLVALDSTGAEKNEAIGLKFTEIPALIKRE